MRVAKRFLAIATILSTVTVASTCSKDSTGPAFGPAAKLAFTAQPSAVVAGAAISPAVKVVVQDAQGNTVTSSTANIALAITSGTGTTGATPGGTLIQTAVAGIATFGNLTLDRTGSGYTLTARATGLTGATSTAFNVTPGAATKLAFTVQPSAVVAGAAITPPVQVEVQDAQGNLVTGSTASITLAITSGTGTAGAHLRGTATVAAVSGVATFSTLSIDSVGTGYTLMAAVTSLTSVASTAFTVSPGAAKKLAFAVQPSAVVSGAAISPAVQVTMQDSLGNTVTSSTANITVAITNGTGTAGAVLGGTLTQAAVAGVATFANLTIDKAGSGYTLTATATSLTSATSTPFIVTPGAATKLAFTVPPSTVAASAAITPAVQVTVRDSLGNTVTASTASVALAITSGTGTAGAVLGGTLTRAAVGGVATFVNLTIDKVGSGYSLTATATSLTSATSTVFTVLPAVASITPVPFGSDDTVIVRGRGLASALLTVNNATIPPLTQSDTLVVFLASGPLPACAGPLPTVHVRLAVGQSAIDTVVPTLGSPLSGPPDVGNHAVLETVASLGCRVGLSAGTYALAVSRTIPPTPATSPPWPNPQDTTRQAVVVDVTVPGTAAMARVQASPRTTPALSGQLDVHRSDVIAPTPSGRPSLSARLRDDASSAACVRPKLVVGDTVRLNDRGLLSENGVSGSTLYRAQFVTTHFQWLVLPSDLDSLTAAQLSTLPYFVAQAETSVYPFLIQTYGTLPDYDGDGRLNVVLRYSLGAAGFYGFTERYSGTGCTSGDFVWLNLWLLPRMEQSAMSMEPLVHEAVHWIDLQDGATYYSKPPWSIEGIAVLSGYLYKAAALGVDYWTVNAGAGRLSDGTTPFLVAGNYGFPYLYFAPGGMNYNAGGAILRYLSEQAIRGGLNPSDVMPRLLGRTGYGDLASVFATLTGAIRREDELQGEFLLMHYADDYVPGISTRLQNGSYDWRAVWSMRGTPYPFPTATVTASTSVMVNFNLSLPDGYVVELTVPSRAVLRFDRPGVGLGLALIRAR